MPVINRRTNTIKNVRWSKSNSAPFYNSKGWRTLRNVYFNSHPLCEQCLMNGISRPAEEVHHIKPFLTGKSDEERWKLLLDINNLMSLCSECHDEVHRRHTKTN